MQRQDAHLHGGRAATHTTVVGEYSKDETDIKNEIRSLQKQVKAQRSTLARRQIKRTVAERLLSLHEAELAHQQALRHDTDNNIKGSPLSDVDKYDAMLERKTSITKWLKAPYERYQQLATRSLPQLVGGKLQKEEDDREQEGEEGKERPLFALQLMQTSIPEDETTELEGPECVEMLTAQQITVDSALKSEALKRMLANHGGTVNFRQLQNFAREIRVFEELESMEQKLKAFCANDGAQKALRAARDHLNAQQIEVTAKKAQLRSAEIALRCIPRRHRTAPSDVEDRRCRLESEKVETDRKVKKMIDEHRNILSNCERKKEVAEEELRREGMRLRGAQERLAHLKKERERVAAEVNPLRNEIKSLRKALKAIDNKQIAARFAELDTSGDGRLSASELLEAMGSSALREEVNTFIEHHDNNGDRRIDMLEFQQYFRQLVS